MIHINDLTFSYNKNSPTILKNINLNIYKGDYISILGENGSAKSTLLKLILNILKPNKGSITVSTNSIGYVPQKIESLNSKFPITVFEMLYCHMKTKDHLTVKDIDKCLMSVNMEDFKDSLLGNLSGGQQQKIFIARALMGNPELLILDEPSTGIDIQSQNDIYNIIKRLNTEKNVTVLSVEHNINAALKNSSHIFELKNGFGYLFTIDEFLKNIEGD